MKPKILTPHFLSCLAVFLTTSALAANDHDSGRGINFSWAGFWRGADLPASTSYSGTTGLVNIPSGEILDQGTFALNRDNFIDRRFSAASESGNGTTLAVGILPFLEVAGRLANFDTSSPPSSNGFDQFVRRDLSVNLKVQIPRFFNGMPYLALGTTDVGGAANNFESTYAVATQPLGPFKLTAGLGNGPDQFDGAFGGIEMDVFNTGVSVLVENDSRDTFAAIRYTSPEIKRALNSRIVTTVSRSFGAMNELNLEDDQTEFSVALQIPLQPRESNGLINGLANAQQGSLPPRALLTTLPQDGDRLAIQRTDVATLPYINAALRQELAVLGEKIYKKDTTQAGYSTERASALQKTLSEHGFEEVRVGLAGSSNEVLVVQYQNYRFINNELDAVGLVLGEAVRNTDGSNIVDIAVVSLKARSPVFEVMVARDRYAAFLAGEHSAVLNGSLKVRPGGYTLDQKVAWLTDKKGRSFVRVMLEPRLTARYGTEVATVDYSAGLATTAFVPLWRGAELSTTYLDQLYKSTNFRPGGAFSGEEIRSGLETMAINQSWWLGDSLLNVSSTGKYLFDYVGVQHESTYFLPFNGDIVRARFSEFELDGVGKPGAPLDQSSSQIAYRTHFHNINSTLEVGYHNYITEDSGVTVDFTRFFGDFSATLSIRDSKRVRFAGLVLGLPISTRSGLKPRYGVQLMGTPAFNTGVFTKVGEDDNLVASVGTALTGYPYNVTNLLLNRGRVSEGYFKTNVGRMREAFYIYGSGE